MKRPKWATQRRYKVVTGPLHGEYLRSNTKTFCSPISVDDRYSDCMGTQGTVLVYTPGKVVRSPNGFCRNQGHTCCRGIHAYRTKDAAQLHAQSTSAIITVWAKAWVGGRVKQRATRVWVGHRCK